MKKRGSLILLYLLASTLVFAAIDLKSEPRIPSTLIHYTEDALHSVMGPRLGLGQRLLAHLKEEATHYTLTLELDGASLVIPIPLNVEAEPSYLADSLRYDGLALIDPPELMIDLVTRTSVIATAPNHKVRVGDRFWATDAQNKHLGLLTTRRVEEHQLIMHQVSGKPLEVGLALERGPKVPLSISALFDFKDSVALQVATELPFGGYPFFLVFEGGSFFNEGGYLGGGLRARLSFSQLFGTNSSLWRNLGIGATATTGVVYSPIDEWSMYAMGTIALEYTLGRWVLFGGVGERIRATVESFHYGLFFSTGTAYTF